MTAGEILTALRRHYGCETDGIGPEWASLDEVELRGPRSRRIDLLLVRAWSGRPKGHERHAVEVKVSRADLRRELTSGKWRAWAAVVHRFYLAVPADLDLDGIELPDRWGVLTVSAQGVRQARRAPRHDEPDELPHRLVVEAFRRASRAEARERHAAAADDPAVELAAVRRQLAAAERRAVTAQEATHREAERARQALQHLAELHPDGVTCRCGTPIRARRGRHGSVAWAHLGDPGPAWSTWSRHNATDRCGYASPDLDALLPEDDEPATA